MTLPTPPSAPRSTAHLAPVFICLAAVALLTTMNALVKGVAGGSSTLQVALMRYTFGAVFIGAIVLAKRPNWPLRASMPAHVLRGVLGATSGTTFFYSLRELSLADAFTIAFLAPLFVALLSMLFLKERPRRVDLLALALGFGGMLVIIGGLEGGAGSRSLFGVAAGAVSAITYAMTLVMLRSMAQRDSYLMVVLFQNFFPALILTPLGVAAWQPLSPVQLAGFAGAGILAVCGHLLLTRAYSSTPAARLAPLEYSSLLYAASIDYVWFGAGLSRDTLLGAALIIAAAMLASRR